MFINIVLFNIYCFISQKKYEKSGATYIFIAERHFIRQEILKKLYIIRTVKIKKLTIK